MFLTKTEELLFLEFRLPVACLA